MKQNEAPLPIFETEVNKWYAIQDLMEPDIVIEIKKGIGFISGPDYCEHGFQILEQLEAEASLCV